MKIDWGSLLQVAVVTLLVTVLIVLLAAFAARLLDAGRVRQQAGRSYTGIFAGAYSLLGLVGLIMLYGLYLIIPYFH